MTNKPKSRRAKRSKRAQDTDETVTSKTQDVDATVVDTAQDADATVADKAKDVDATVAKEALDVDATIPSPEFEDRSADPAEASSTRAHVEATEDDEPIVEPPPDQKPNKKSRRHKKKAPKPAEFKRPVERKGPLSYASLEAASAKMLRRTDPRPGDRPMAKKPTHEDLQHLALDLHADLLFVSKLDMQTTAAFAEIDSPDTLAVPFPKLFDDEGYVRKAHDLHVAGLLNTRMKEEWSRELVVQLKEKGMYENPTMEEMRKSWGPGPSAPSI